MRPSYPTTTNPTKKSHSEHLLSEIVGAAPLPGVRHANMESLYEYGSRAGFWRLHRLFTEKQLPVTGAWGLGAV